MKMSKSMNDYIEYSLRELYSLEELLESYGQHQMVDVLHSVVEMTYSKLHALDEAVSRDLGPLEVQMNETGELVKVKLASQSKTKQPLH